MKLFILSDRPNNQEGIRCLKAGCSGYSNTYIGAARLELAVRSIRSGLVWTGTSLLQHLLHNVEDEEGDEPENQGQQQEISDRLSKRELQIASLVAEGLQNREIADRLGITERTVKAHLSSVYSKTGASNRISLAKKLEYH